MLISDRSVITTIISLIFFGCAFQKPSITYDCLDQALRNGLYEKRINSLEPVGFYLQLSDTAGYIKYRRTDSLPYDTLYVVNGRKYLDCISSVPVYLIDTSDTNNHLKTLKDTCDFECVFMIKGRYTEVALIKGKLMLKILDKYNRGCWVVPLEEYRVSK
jgi:hypothetical protein